MLFSVALIATIGFAIWLAAKLVYGNAGKAVRLALTVLPVVAGFALLRWGSDPQALSAGEAELTALSMAGLILALGGLVCGLSIAVLGTIKGLAPHRKGTRK